MPSWIKRVLAGLGRVPSPRAVAVVCLLALVQRLALSGVSHGSNDIETWARFADYIVRYGLLRLYVLDAKFNHPPLMGLYSVLADQATVIFQVRFAVAFKILPIVASVATIYLVQRIGHLKLIWLLLFAFNPLDTLVSAYHGNTDSMCAAFCVAAALFADFELPWLSGFSLGAAMNVKLIPVVLIAPLFLSLKPRQMWKFALALTLAAAPFVPIFLGPWAAFKRNAIDYNSSIARWGVGLLISTLDGHLAAWQMPAHELSVKLGKPLILGSGLVLGLIQRRVRVFSCTELCALVMACFLAFAPGFGVQYLVYPVALLVASHARGAFTYAYLAGFFAFLLYFGFLVDYSVPLVSHFRRLFDERSVLAGFLTWLWLVRYIVREVRSIPGRMRGARVAPVAPVLEPEL